VSEIAGKNPLRTTKSGWENNIKMGFGKIRTGNLKLFQFSHDSV
jgi:hypothetical protein